MIFELLVAGAFALATLRRYSLAHTATLTSLAFFLSSGLSVVSAAPSYGLHNTFSKTIAMEPWVQPCGTPIAAAMRRAPQRHNVHRTLKRVRIQLRVAQNHFRKNLEDIHDIYAKVYKVLKEQYRMNWLPEKQLEWYHREVWCLEKGKKAERALPRLHDALQRFAITFHHLRTFRLKSNINADVTFSRRNQIIDGMFKEILRMLCEVETAITNLGIQLPQTHKAVIVTGNSNWANEGDLTLMLIQDSGVLRLYQAFLNDWIRAFRNATAIGPGTCDPSTVQPLTPRPKKATTPKKASKGQQTKRPKKTAHLVSASGKNGNGLGKNRVIMQGPRKLPRKRFPKKKAQRAL